MPIPTFHIALQGYLRDIISPGFHEALTNIRSAANCGPYKLFRLVTVCVCGWLPACECPVRVVVLVGFELFFYVPRKPSRLPSPLPVATVVHAADLSIVTATRGCGSATHSRPRVLFAHNGKSSGLGGFSSFSSFPCFPTFPATQGKA